MHTEAVRSGDGCAGNGAGFMPWSLSRRRSRDLAIRSPKSGRDGCAPYWPNTGKCWPSASQVLARCFFRCDTAPEPSRATSLVALSARLRASVRAIPASWAGHWRSSLYSAEKPTEHVPADAPNCRRRLAPAPDSFWGFGKRRLPLRRELSRVHPTGKHGLQASPEPLLTTTTVETTPKLHTARPPLAALVRCARYAQHDANACHAPRPRRGARAH